MRRGFRFNSTSGPIPILMGASMLMFVTKTSALSISFRKISIPCCGLQVYGNAALVAVVAFKIIVRTLEACCGADQTHKAARRIAFFGLDFNDIGSKISQSCPSFRPLLKHRDFYNPNTG